MEKSHFQLSCVFFFFCWIQKVRRTVDIHTDTVCVLYVKVYIFLLCLLKMCTHWHFSTLWYSLLSSLVISRQHISPFYPETFEKNVIPSKRAFIFLYLTFSQLCVEKQSKSHFFFFSSHFCFWWLVLHLMWLSLTSWPRLSTCVGTSRRGLNQKRKSWL